MNEDGKPNIWYTGGRPETHYRKDDPMTDEEMTDEEKSISTATAQFKKCLSFTLTEEGSEYTNDPDDHGGATRYGITQREYNHYRAIVNRPAQSVREIQEAEWEAIYLLNYWLPIRAPELPLGVDLITFDTAVLMGVHRASQFLQRSIGVDDDGRVGNVTLQSVHQHDAHHIVESVASLRLSRLLEIATHKGQSKFRKGWIARSNRIRRAAELMTEGKL